MAAWRQGIAAGLAGLAVGTAGAQMQVELAPSDAVRCLTPPQAQRSALEYPFDQWKQGSDGDVRVELTFAGPDLAPSTKLLKLQGDEAFGEEVKRHVQAWRVPCMAAGAAPVRLVQDFAFRSSLKAPIAGPPQDATAELQEKLLACWRHVGGLERPAYPRQALATSLQGRVVTRLTFRDPAQPPEAQIFARDSARLLRDQVERFVAGLRLPCLSGEEVSADILFIYRIEGEGAFGFKPLTLVDLLGLGKGMRQRTLRLDTNTMRCPFDVRFQYRRPFLANRLALTGDPIPEREPLLALLRELEVDAPDRALDSIFGDTTLVTIPCIKIDLNPQGDKS